MRKNLLQEGIEGIRRLLYLIPSKPEVAQIEITNRCNFNCVMCQRFPLKVPIKDMNLKIYKRIIDRLGVIKEVILTGWGEPLLHPQMIEMISYAKSNNKSVCLTSNGSLLKGTLVKQLIEAGLDSISFSIDEIRSSKKGSIVHPITIQINNIEKFMEMIKNNKKRPTVIIQSTLHEDREKNILEVIKWASKINATMVNVNRLDMRFQKNLRRPNYLEEKKFINTLDNWGRRYGIRTEFRPHIAFSGVARLFYRFLAPYMGLGGKHCLRVYNYIYVNMSGGVSPCCALPLWEVGNLFKNDLGDIWRSEKFQKFRQHDFQRKVCGQCDVLEVKQWCR